MVGGDNRGATGQTIQNADLAMQLEDGRESEATSKESHKIKIRQTRADSKTFATGVEVIEHEIELQGDGTIRKSGKLPGEGHLTDKQLKEILQNLKQ